MSFSQKLKNEIAKSKLPKSIDNIKYELLGMYIANSSYKDEKTYFSSENLSILERYKYAIKYLFSKNNMQYNFDIDKQKNIYFLECDNLRNILPKEIKLKDLSASLKTSLLIGIFLGCGYVNDPKDNYHFEFITRTSNDANLINELLICMNISSSITKRNNKYIVYIKDGDNISNIIGILGASTSLVEFEVLRVEKEMNNNLNRVINCETANLNKSINASKKHIDNIYYLKKTGEYNKLNDNLKIVCDKRIENPESSLSELAEIIGISKSGLNNRLTKLDNIVKELKKDD